MSLRSVDVDAVTQYVSPRDPDHESWHTGIPGNATIFSLKNLSAADLGQILDETQEVVTSADGARAIKVNINARYLLLARTAVVGWHNFVDERGNAVRFTLSNDNGQRPRVSLESIAALPSWLVRELALRIIGENSMSRTEEKNSGASFDEQ